MEALFDHEFMQSLPGQRFRATGAENTALAGLRKSNAKGNSVEFSDFREYLPGDDIRRLDWNVYARLGKLYMKLFMEEKEAVFSIYIDLSASMNYGEKPKRRQALRLAAVLSYMALGGQDRVRIILCGLPDKKYAFPLSLTFHGSASFNRLLAWLAEAEKEVEQEAQKEAGVEGRAEGEAEVAYPSEDNIWANVKKQMPPLSGTSILISDFLPDDIEETVKYLRFYRKQKILLFQILAEEELHPDLEGTKLLLDMENAGNTGNTGKTGNKENAGNILSGGKNQIGMRITLTPAVRNAYQKRLEAMFLHLKQLSSRYQCHYQCIQSGEKASAFLYQAGDLLQK